MTRNELRDILIQAKQLLVELERIWRYAKEIDLEAIPDISSPCESCEPKKL